MAQDRARTEADVANLALAELGEPPIAALTDNVARARVVAALFGTARDDALRAYDWAFATRWLKPPALATLSTGPLQYRFPMPDSCLRVRFLTDASIASAAGTATLDPDDMPEFPWDIEAPEEFDGQVAPAAVVVVTNVTTPWICYTTRVTNPTQWDTEFVKAFAKTLAGMAAPQIMKDPARVEAIQNRAADELATAGLDNSREGAPKTVSRDVSWVRARRVGVAYRPAYRDTGD